MAFTAQDVKALRESTGAGMMDCKKALEETGGDIDAAKQYLREKGLAASAKRDDRENNQGVVATKVDGGVGAIVQLKSETDFVAGSEQFKAEADALVDLVALENVSTTWTNQHSPRVAAQGNDRFLRAVDDGAADGLHLRRSYLAPGQPVPLLDPQFGDGGTADYDVDTQVGLTEEETVTRLRLWNDRPVVAGTAEYFLGGPLMYLLRAENRHDCRIGDGTPRSFPPGAVPRGSDDRSTPACFM